MRFSTTFAVLFTLVASSTAGAEDRTLSTWKTTRLSDVFYSEGAGVGDFNKDGKTDVVSGPFWYAGPDFKKRHVYYEPKPFSPLGYSDNFFAYSEDFNGDGWEDILIIGFPGKDASWFENPQGKDRFWTRHKVFDIVDNESPQYVDLTGDGKREIVCSSGGYFGFIEPNRVAPEKPWKFRRIFGKATGGRFVHGLGIGDVNGDGRADLLEKSGWWEQPASLDGDPAWKKHAVQFSGPGGAQMFAYDFDGDGDNDVLTSLAAHGFGLAWYEQTKGDDGIAFKQHLITGKTPGENRYGVAFSELHGVDLVDMDGDGLKDIVTGKRYWSHGPGKSDHFDRNDPPVVYWFKTVHKKQPAAQGNVDFVPHLIHNESGVGVEVKARDINGDGLPDVIVGNKKGTFIHIQSRRKVAKAEWLRAQPIAREELAKPTKDGLARAEGLQPKEAAKAMTAPAGFTVQLAAGEPQVHQPVALAIDERGRVWVAEAYTYPKRAPEGEGRDRIIILEDKDGDGTLESRKVFTEGLNLVSGMQVGFGGVWVGAAPYLMFIPDANRDDKPDGPPQILLDGFGYQDTHETLNAFIWGPDGWLYGCHGVFTYSKVGKPGTPDEERTPLNAGVWRYHPVRHEFEMFARGTSNPWGVDFNDHGQAFVTACVIPHLFHIIQGARYHRQGGRHYNPYVYDDIKTIADHAHYAGNIRDHAWWGRNEAVAHDTTDKAGGGHAHCGAMIYLGDNWPDQYRNSIFMSNIHGNRVNNDILEREGSGYVGRHGADFLFANDRWFRGINLKYGPDGGVYMIDWYDKNACHRGNAEIWDRTNGRVYKITYGETQPVKVDLSKLSDAELVELQLHRNDWYVRTARRLLQERFNNPVTRLSSPSYQPDRGLINIIKNNPDVTRKLRALWTLHVIGGLHEELALGLLDSKSEYVRAWTIQLELEDEECSDVFIAKLASLSHTDPSPVVRLYLASALQRLPLDQRWNIAAGLMKQGKDAGDHNLPLLIWYGIEPLVTEKPQLALALALSTKIPLLTRHIVRRAAVDPVAVDVALTSLGQVGDESAQLLMLEEIRKVVAERANLKMPKSWPDVYKKLSQSKTAAVREHAQFITVKFGDKSIFPVLRGIVADSKTPVTSRTQALSALLDGRDAELPALMHRLLDDGKLRRPALRGLARFDHRETPKQILSRYKKYNADERGDAVLTLASRKTYALELLDAMKAGTVPRSDMSAFTVRQLQRYDDKELLAILNSVWGQIRSTSADKVKRIAGFKKALLPKTLASADLPHGRELYKETCAKCHKLFGDGGKIGPDITGSNRRNLDYLLENMLDPSAVVGRDFLMTTVATKGGRVLSGLIVLENESALTLQTVNEKVVVALDDIEVRKKSKISMMPEGQLDKLKPNDIRDLIAYLGSPSQIPLPGELPPLNAKTGRVAGALEGEAMKIVGRTSGNARSQKMREFGNNKWSGADHLWWTGGKPGDKLTLDIAVPTAGNYELYAAMTKARDYGIVQLLLDGKTIGRPVDLFNAAAVIPTGPISFGTHELTAGNHRLTFVIVGSTPKAVKSYMFGLDYVFPARQAKK